MPLVVPSAEFKPWMPKAAGSLSAHAQKCALLYLKDKSFSQDLAKSPQKNPLACKILQPGSASPGLFLHIYNVTAACDSPGSFRNQVKAVASHQPDLVDQPCILRQPGKQMCPWPETPRMLLSSSKPKEGQSDAHIMYVSVDLLASN